MKSQLLNLALYLRRRYLLFVFLLGLSTPISAQNGNRVWDENPNTITLPNNVPNTVQFKNIVGINEVGYTFWDHVYSSTEHTVVDPIIANAFKSTFPKIRIFHETHKDYNLNGLSSNTPANTTTLTQCASGWSRDHFCALKNFYEILKSDGYLIASSQQSSIHEFPNKWFTAAEWGGSDYIIKDEARLYAIAFLQNMDPNKNNTRLIDRFYTSNEAWGNLLGVNGYKNVCDGFIQGFTEYYQSVGATPNPSTWNIKLWLGAFQANDANSTFDNDYISTMLSTNAREYLQGIDIHPYSFLQNEPYNNSTNLREHPESPVSYFLAIKNMVRWRNSQTGNAAQFKISATEFGWNSSDVYERVPYTYTSTNNNETKTAWVMKKKNANTGSNLINDPSDWSVATSGIGQEAQALYIIRAYLMMARFGLESAYIYGTFNNDESLFGTCGVYQTELYKTVLNDDSANSGFFTFSPTHFTNTPTTTLTEKKVMPAIRKLRNSAIIGDKVYMQSLIENNDTINGVYAYLVGTGSGTPTHLVAWRAKKINNHSEAEILTQTIQKTLSQINFPTNYAISTSSNCTRLDWNESLVNNISNSTVYNSSTNTITLTPIPIVIPITTASCSNNITSPGSISSTSENACMPYDPAIITSTAEASGGTGNLEYIWQLSTTSATSGFSIIAGETTNSFNPSTINVSTWYRRGARRAGCPNYLFTPAIAKLNSNVTTAGAIGTNQLVCGTGGTTNNPVLLTNISSASGGTGTIVYRWQKSTTSATSGFSTITNQTNDTYNPPAITQTTWYRRGARTGNCTYKNSNVVKVTYNPNCKDIGIIFLETCIIDGNVRMKLKIENLGTTTESNVIVNFPNLCGGNNPNGTSVPAGTTFDESASCTTAPHPKWTINSIAPGASYTLIIEYYLAAGATVTANHNTAGDTNSSNNTATFTNSGLSSCSSGNSVDFSVAFSTICKTVTGNTKMTITATNLGTQSLTNAVVNFPNLCGGNNPNGTSVPAGTTFDESASCTTAPYPKWTINSIAPGASYTLIIEYYLAADATVNANNTTAGDANTTNNTASFTNSNISGCSGKSNTSLIQNDQSTLLEVIPNPFNDYVKLQVNSQDDENVEITIYNSLGIEIMKKSWNLIQGNNSLFIDTDNAFKNGIYIISAKFYNGKQVCKKIVKNTL